MALVSLAAFGGCVSKGRNVPATPSPKPAPSPIVAAAPASIVLPDSVRVRVGGQIQTVALDDYVLATVLSEVTPFGETDSAAATIFEVQAIVARTYAVAEAGRHRAEGFDLCDTTHCQLYEPARIRTSRFAPAAKAAVERTRGRVLVYGSHVAEALFHSDCGGQTASADAVWGGQPVPYLHTIVDQLAPDTHRTWTVTATSDQLRGALNTDPRTEVGQRLDAIDILARDTSGRAMSIGLRGELTTMVRSDLLRSVLSQQMGDKGALLSTRFDIARNGKSYTFTGTGFGHGVGLCQHGMIVRARRGEATKDILATYFPGTVVAVPKD